MIRWSRTITAPDRPRSQVARPPTTGTRPTKYSSQLGLGRPGAASGSPGVAGSVATGGSAAAGSGPAGWSAGICRLWQHRLAPAPDAVPSAAPASPVPAAPAQAQPKPNRPGPGSTQAQPPRLQLSPSPGQGAPIQPGPNRRRQSPDQRAARPVRAQSRGLGLSSRLAPRPVERVPLGRRPQSWRAQSRGRQPIPPSTRAAQRPKPAGLSRGRPRKQGLRAPARWRPARL
jgi:hypothetical protein